MQSELDAKFREFRDGGENGFDPLDLGCDDGEDVRTPGRGRPSAPICDLARASYWAWSVQRAAGKSFAELEREMTLLPFSQRDGGGFNQPHAWLSARV